MQAIARRCRESLRCTDALGRSREDDLLILLPETELDGARVVAERLKADLARLPELAQPGPIGEPVRVGVAAVRQDVADGTALIDRAKAACYAA